MIVKIERLNHQGEGITFVNGKITFVPNTLPNEIVDITIVKENKKINNARLNKVIEKNKFRIEPKCPYYKECGGCDFAHTTYENEICLKTQKVKDVLKKFANIDFDIEVIKSEKTEHYRNKVTLHQKNRKIGYYKKNSNDLVEINSCELLMENINKKIKSLKTNEEQIIIKENNSGEIISSLESGEFIIDAWNNKFTVNINSFFQVNPYCYNKLFEYILSNIKPNEVLLDLYCGVGTFSIILSEKFKKIYGVEINEDAYKNALKNKKINNKENIEFLLGKVEDEIDKIKQHVDTILVDPPRNGLDNKTKKFINEIKPNELVYVSCNPITLSRDLCELKEKFNIKSIKCFDLFPRTEHVETVVFLTLK